MQQEPQSNRLELELFTYAKIDVEETFEEWSEKMMDWTFHPVYNNESLVAVIAALKNEIHVVIDKDYRGKWYKRDQVGKIFKDMIDEYGSVITCVGMENKEGMEFVKRLGFVPNNINCVLKESNYVC